MGAQGWPRVSKMTPQILPKFIDKRGPGPGAHPKGAKGTPGPSKSQKIHVLLRFVVRTSETQYPKKGEHSVLFSKHVW